jgi:hypothetical protein
MSRARKITVVALIAAAAGMGWKRRGWLYYMWATWRESKN